MNSEIKIIRENITPGRRILVTSDIHGHFTHLKEVLNKAAFSSNDLLVIVGDIIEKGPESLKSLRYVMDLCKTGNVIVLAGNVDMWRLQMIDDINESSAADFFNYLLFMRKWYKTSFFDEMTLELGFLTENSTAVLSAKYKITSLFRTEFDFLRSLPTVLETQNYVFVHGGLPESSLHNISSYNIYNLLKYDDFMSSGLCFNKYVVVGHWPVTLYGDKKSQSNPIINKEQKIIFIDGGCGIKDDGQLNLMIIPDMDCHIDSISFISHDTFPAFNALTSQDEAPDSIHIRWRDNEIKALEKRDDFTYAEHISSGRRLWIYNEYLYDDNHCEDYTDYTLEVEAGDKLSLIHETSKGYIVKKNGVTGWYYGKLEK